MFMCSTTLTYIAINFIRMNEQKSTRHRELEHVHILVIIYIQRKIFFKATIFLYSPCPNLEGIKDALFYKFRRLTIGQNCCAVCTNEVARA